MILDILALIVFDWPHRQDMPWLTLLDHLTVARSSHCGGGVAIIFRNNWKSALFPLPRCTTFQALAVQLSLSAVQFVILLVYWPGLEEVS